MFYEIRFVQRVIYLNYRNKSFLYFDEGSYRNRVTFQIRISNDYVLQQGVEKRLPEDVNTGIGIDRGK